MQGKIVDELTLNHEIYSEKFYSFTLVTVRRSGVEDNIKVVISERLMIDKKFNIGDTVNVEGQFRSHNEFSEDGKNKLQLMVFAGSISHAEEEKSINEIFLDGFICKKPVYRSTPMGREITDLLIAVNRGYNKSDYLPIVVWGRTARYAETLKIGMRVNLYGRIQSRTYLKHIDDETTEERTAYEVSVNRLERFRAEEQQ